MSKALDKQIITCEKCPRLIKHCQKVAKEKRKSFQDWEYWGKPVPNFGDPKAKLLIVGLAPAAHGANRTGRMFTGDRSGEWLYGALHRFGFASQSLSESRFDHLRLNKTLITAVTHCAPPDNKPTTQEIENCRLYLTQVFQKTPFQVVLALGGIAWEACLKELSVTGEIKNLKQRPKFSHGAEVLLSKGRVLLGSYHPSQQNTFTGRLTVKMFDSIFKRSQEIIM